MWCTHTIWTKLYSWYYCCKWHLNYFQLYKWDSDVICWQNLLHHDLYHQEMKWVILKFWSYCPTLPAVNELSIFLKILLKSPYTLRLSNPLHCLADEDQRDTHIHTHPQSRHNPCVCVYCVFSLSLSSWMMVKLSSEFCRRHRCCPPVNAAQTHTAMTQDNYQPPLPPHTCTH